MEIKLTGVSNLRSEYGDYDHDVILSNDLIESSGFVDIIIDDTPITLDITQLYVATKALYETYSMEQDNQIYQQQIRN